MFTATFAKYFPNWALPHELHAKGIVGMNRRNMRYIARYNPRHLYPLVDDKLQTKMLASRHGITTPELIATVTSQGDVVGLIARLQGRDRFVIKPAKGSGGKGILLIDRVEGDNFVKPNGTSIDRETLEQHVSNILSGIYSLGGATDVALIEAMINFDPRLLEYTYEGVPDIRVIVFLGFPVMAMMRLSTSASDGKANLHKGAVGVGIDIGSGRAIRGVQFDHPCERHPDTGHELASLQIPSWRTLLLQAAGCYEMTGLGYIGTDMVLDRDFGPMLLELNARPGLTIQIANGEGLRHRLELIERQKGQMSITERVDFAQQHFARIPL